MNLWKVIFIHLESKCWYCVVLKPSLESTTMDIHTSVLNVVIARALMAAGGGVYDQIVKPR